MRAPLLRQQQPEWHMVSLRTHHWSFRLTGAGVCQRPLGTSQGILRPLMNDDAPEGGWRRRQSELGPTIESLKRVGQVLILAGYVDAKDRRVLPAIVGLWRPWTYKKEEKSETNRPGRLTPIGRHTKPEEM
jgi:hypothetical protein